MARTEWDGRYSATNAGLGYTLATGRLFVSVPEFHAFAEWLLDRPVLTHEFATAWVWTEMRETFEGLCSDLIGPERSEGPRLSTPTTARDRAEEA